MFKAVLIDLPGQYRGRLERLHRAGYRWGAGHPKPPLPKGHADAIAFGRVFISSPNLPLRLQHGYPLTPYNRKTFSRCDVARHTDYPFYDVMAPA